MNPSAKGWIKKLLFEIENNDISISNTNDFYCQLRRTGFIYGTNISTFPLVKESFNLTEEEYCKLNLFLSFYVIHKNQESNTDFLSSLVNYYSLLGQEKRSFLGSVFGSKSSDEILEDIIEKRILINDGFISKNFNLHIINVLLFIDVLGYIKYLESSSEAKNYVIKLEVTIEEIVGQIIENKSHKSNYDKKLLNLFKNSTRHSSDFNNYYKPFNKIKSTLEKLYIIDILCMASWSDSVLEHSELEFLRTIQHHFELNDEVINSSVTDLNNFFLSYKNNIAFLSSNTIAHNIYSNSSKFVYKLISRNKKRLLRELSESKEAMVLLTASTVRNLTDEEQKKMQNQLMDIFKTIPSLAIFMLPGGAVLLPLVIKLIPKLLPSAFDDNRIKKED